MMYIVYRLSIVSHAANQASIDLLASLRLQAACGLAAAGDATVCSLIGTAYRAFIIIYSVRLSVLQDN